MHDALLQVRRLACPLLLGLLGGLAFPFFSRADDWPQWRGPQRDGVWRETGICQKFTGPRLELAWRAEIGSGYSGPTVAKGRVFVTDRRTDPEQIERVLCFDAKSGAPLWSHQYACPYEGIDYTAGPRACVTVYDSRAYALGAMGHLHCFDAGAGALLWKHDLNAEYKLRMPIWGIAAAPLIYDDLVIVQCGGAEGANLVAFDRKDGDERWRALNDRCSYSAPILVRRGDRDLLICWTGDAVVGLNPATGETLWRYNFPPSKMVIGIATPVVEGNRLFVTSFYDGSLMLRLHEDGLGVTREWQKRGRDEQNTEALHSIISTPVIDGEHIYGDDSYGQLRCLSAATGERLWEDKTATPPGRWSNLHFVRQGDRWWLFNEAGELIIAELAPQGFRELSRAKLLDPTTDQLRRRNGVCWSHPAFANRHVFARSDKELVCASLEE